MPNSWIAALLQRSTRSFRRPAASFEVTVKGRDYWYFQQGARDASGSQPRKYVGADTPDVRKRIEEHKQAKDDYRERRHLIATLRRAGFQSPPDQTGAILAALGAAGVFRLRACLIGTVAYQVYGPMLGVRLPHAILQTGDIDIAQFTTVSTAISKDERMPSLLEALQKAEPSFRAVPHLKAGVAASYVNGSGFRVDVLTENRGPERDAPTRLPALGTHALPLRFLDFLIYEGSVGKVGVTSLSPGAGLIPAARLVDSNVIWCGSERYDSASPLDGGDSDDRSDHPFGAIGG